MPCTTKEPWGSRVSIEFAIENESTSRPRKVQRLDLAMFIISKDWLPYGKNMQWEMIS